MKKLIIAALILAGLSGAHHAEAARLATFGAELNSQTADMEQTNVLGAAATIISTSTDSGGVISGDYAYKISSLTSARHNWVYQFASASGNGPYYFRFNFKLTTAATGLTTIFCTSSSNSTSGGCVSDLQINSSSQLVMIANSISSTSTSAALSLNATNTIEMLFDNTLGANKGVERVKLNGVEFAATTTANFASGILSFRWGGNVRAESQTAPVFYFDDFGVNDSTGSFQNSYLGTGYVLFQRVSANGTSTPTWTRGGTDSGANWSQLQELTPNDVTNYNQSKTAAQYDTYETVDTPTALNSNSTINAVQIGGRFRADVASNNSSFKLGIRDNSGNVEESSAITPNTTTWTSNALAAPRNAPLTLYDMPGSSTALITKTDLDGMKIQVDLTAASTNNVQVSSEWMVIDYTPGAATSSYKPSIFINNGIFSILGGTLYIP